MMNTDMNLKKDLYYTKDHEWIHFKGTIASIGICNFKLLGFKEIHKIIFSETGGLMKQGDLIAKIRYKDYQIEAHMPVDGKVSQVNEILLSGFENTLLKQPEDAGWIATIIPSQPYERGGLLLPKQYQMNGKSKFAK